MVVSKSFWDEQLNRLAYQLAARVSEQLFSLGINSFNAPVNRNEQSSVGCRIEKIIHIGVIWLFIFFVIGHRVFPVKSRRLMGATSPCRSEGGVKHNIKWLAAVSESSATYGYALCQCLTDRALA